MVFVIYFPSLILGLPSVCETLKPLLQPTQRTVRVQSA